MSVEPEKSKLNPKASKNSPWIEKYRPVEFNQIVGKSLVKVNSCNLFFLKSI